MKKSKIIIPAAAILALSVGASVTGTVAWFTASSRVSVTANNLAVINAQGALSATNEAKIGCTVAGDGSVSLEYLQDASYNHETGHTFVAVLDTDGNVVTGSREVSTSSFRTLNINNADKKIYYVSQWETTFATSSQETQYLFFDNHLAKSYIDGGADTAEIYRALRVSMVCGEKKILWAPYTNEGTLYYLNTATTLAPEKQYDVDGTEKGASTVKQKISEAFGSAVTSATRLGEQSNIVEGDLKATADGHALLLSDSLIKAGSAVKVTTTVWFEGLDQDCVDGKSGLNTITASGLSKTLTLSYYAVAASSLVAQ